MKLLSTLTILALAAVAFVSAEDAAGAHAAGLGKKQDKKARIDHG